MSSLDISSPAEVEIHSERRVWGPWATAGFGLIVIIISFIIQTLVVVIFAFVKIFSIFDPSLGRPQFEMLLSAVEEVLGTYEGLLVAMATSLSMVICVGLILIIIKVRRSASIVEYLGLSPISGKRILVVLAIMAGFIILSDCLSLLLGRRIYPEYMVDIYNTSVWPLLFWIALIICAPVFEETLFRGFLFEGFRQSRIGAIGAIGLTALAWALLHIQYDLHDIATIFVMGIMIGIVRLRTNSLWSPLIMHAFANLVATLEVSLNLNRLVS